MKSDKSDTMYDLIFTIDCTGSMYAVLSEVRRQVEWMTKQLFEVLPNLRVAIVAHGDYCDEKIYVTKQLDFTDDVSEISKFVRTVEPTDGGDLPECYELVLREIRSLSWRTNSTKLVVLIGDALPHERGYTYREKDIPKRVDIDWLNELKLLVEFGIKIFGVHCLASMRQYSKKFYETIARASDGTYITLDQLSTVVDAVLAIAYLEQFGVAGVKEYQAEVHSREDKRGGRIRREHDKIFEDLGGEKTEVRKRTTGGLVAVTPGTFQMLYVPDRIPMKQFIAENGLTFAKGKSFYQFVSREIIQQYKKIVLMDRTGDLYTGADARKVVGIPYGEKRRMSPQDVSGYDKVFIQSTSHTRVLDANTYFLYVISDLGPEFDPYKDSPGE